MEIQAALKGVLKTDTAVIAAFAAVGFFGTRVLHNTLVSKVDALTPYRELTAVAVMVLATVFATGNNRIAAIGGAGVSLVDDLAKRGGIELV